MNIVKSIAITKGDSKDYKGYFINVEYEKIDNEYLLDTLGLYTNETFYADTMDDMIRILKSLNLYK